MNFQQLILDYAPSYMRARWISIFLESIGATLDAQAERLILGRRASSVSRCEPDVLPWHAQDRGIQLYPSEPIASQRYRLSRWHQLRRRKGTHLGCLENMQPYFLPGMLPTIRIVHQDGAGSSATWHTMGPSGAYSVYRATPSNWNFDGATAKWSRWWVILDVSALPVNALGATLAHYNDGSTYDQPGLVYDGIATAVVTDLVDMALDWKAAHSMLWGFVVTRQAGTFDPKATAVTSAEGWTSLPVGNWGAPTDPATGLLTRPPYAAWLYDLGQG